MSLEEKTTQEEMDILGNYWCHFIWIVKIYVNLESGQEHHCGQFLKNPNFSLLFL